MKIIAILAIVSLTGCAYGGSYRDNNTYNKGELFTTITSDINR